MNITYNNEWMYFNSGSSILQIRLNHLLNKNIGILRKISNDVDGDNITKDSYSFYYMKLNHWKREDLLKAIKVTELFLPNSPKDKDVLELLSYDVLKELLYRLKGG